MRILYFLIFFTLSSFLSYGQTTGNSKTGGNINVDNYQIWWRINPDSAKGIKGVVKIKFKTAVANVSKISFDLSSLLTVSQVTFRGTNLTLASIGRTGDSIVIPLGTTIAAIGSRDSITISYAGVPQNGNSGTGGGRLGYTKDVDPSVTAAESAGAGPKRGFPVSTGSGNYVWTLAESYEDRDWWPCKADMQDKADTIDITVNVPWRTNNANAALATDTFWVATNGTLVDSTFDISVPQANRNRSFTFINRYPMTTYLVSVCVARFNRYYRGTIPVGGFNVPVVYYLFPGKSSYTSILAAMDKVTELVTAFGTKYGDYGFVDPAKGGKHGFYEGLGAFGGEEHQTFSGISSNSLTSKSLLSHELAHQWFGDKVSFSTFNDLWLAEGFAEYSPAYAADLITGMGYTSLSQRQSFKANAISETVSAYIPSGNIVNSDKIWGTTTGNGYQSTVYDRGAMIVSMLRTLAGEAKFVEALTDYQQSATTQYKSATTDTLVAKFNKALGAGIDLTQFFTDNVKGTGYPTNTIKYAQRFGPYDSVYFKVTNQTRTNSTNTYFQQPVVIHIQKNTAPVKDTTIVLYDWGAGKVSKAGNGLSAIKTDSVGYRLSFRPDSYMVDTSARTMSSANAISGTSLLGTGVLDLRVTDFYAKPHQGYNTAILVLDDNSIHSEVILERSADALNFKELGIMNLLADNFNAGKQYLFKDANPLQTENYYRAKFKNANGIYIYSAVVKIATLKTGLFSLLNNPADDVLQIKTSPQLLNNAISIAVADEAGKIVFTRQINNAETVTDIPVSTLKRAVYVLKITTATGEFQSIKFIKN